MTPISPPLPVIKHPEHGTPSAVWTYRTATGAPVGYVCRFNDADGNKKAVIPCIPNGAGIKWLSFPKPRPLYGLELLSANPKAQILAVEGEKTADAARRLLAGIPIVAVTWPGGCKAVQHADWSALAGRQVICFPDADAKRYINDDKSEGDYKPLHEQNGTKAMLDVAAALEGIAARVKIVRLPAPGAELADGWDLADAEAEGWDRQRVMEYIKARLVTAADLLPPPDLTPDRLAEMQANLDALAEEDRQRDAAERERVNAGETELPPPDDAGRPFRMLGYDHGTYYYLPSGGKQVVALSAAGHSSSGLLQLAPYSTWERDCRSKKGVDWTLAMDACIQAQHRFGIFDPERIRGRGAWWDDGRAIYHAGDHLLVDFQKTRIQDVTSRFIYEESKPLATDRADPLGTKQANEFIKLCERFSWERPISARLLAGWCAVATICGALYWRPHIWITGGAGTGKSYIMDNVIARLLGQTALKAQSETTSAGVRQTLRTDAMPITFDEFESNDGKKNADRVQDMLALARQASSESGARIIKGSATGDAVAYGIRSCFCFASIGVSTKQYADATRITVLSLVQRELRPGQFEQLSAAVNDLLTEEYCAAFRARAMRNVASIRANAKTFAAAGAAVLGTQRLGDQLGALLAGAYSLFSEKLVTPELAMEWIAKQDWSEERNLGDDPDERRCLNHILQSIQRVNTHRGGTVDRSVSEMIGTAAGTNLDPDVGGADARDGLLRIGIKLKDGDVWIAYSGVGLGRIMKDTPWELGWSRTLRRLKGVVPQEKSRFGLHVIDRAVAVPMGLLTGADK